MNIYIIIYIIGYLISLPIIAKNQFNSWQTKYPNIAKECKDEDANFAIFVAMFYSLIWPLTIIYALIYNWLIKQ
jgi:hypothetical protein